MFHYHINGKISRMENYKHGIKNGIDQFYDKNSRMYWSGNYKDGTLIDEKSYLNNGSFNLY